MSSLSGDDSTYNFVGGCVHLERIARNESGGNDEGCSSLHGLGKLVNRILDNIQLFEVDSRRVDRSDFLDHGTTDNGRRFSQRSSGLFDVANSADDLEVSCLGQSF